MQQNLGNRTNLGNSILESQKFPEFGTELRGLVRGVKDNTISVLKNDEIAELKKFENVDFGTDEDFVWEEVADEDDLEFEDVDELRKDELILDIIEGMKRWDEDENLKKSYFGV